jgi:hypothetical protein
VAMKFWDRQNIAAIIAQGQGQDQGQGGDRNRDISKAAPADSVCGGWRDRRRCVRTAVMPKQVT